MTSLAEKEGLKGKVQAIYLDPPYGIKFGSNWQVSTRKRDVKDGRAQDATRQPEQVRAFRDTWKLGIHSYLSYLRDRLVVARDLLTETGSIFVQIGDENVHRVRALMDEVFGEESFAVIITMKKTAAWKGSQSGLASDFILWFARNQRDTSNFDVYFSKPKNPEEDSAYSLSKNVGQLSTDYRISNRRSAPHVYARGRLAFSAGRTTLVEFTPLKYLGEYIHQRRKRRLEDQS